MKGMMRLKAKTVRRGVAVSAAPLWSGGSVSLRWRGLGEGMEKIGKVGKRGRVGESADAIPQAVPCGKLGGELGFGVLSGFACLEEGGGEAENGGRIEGGVGGDGGEVGGVDFVLEGKGVCEPHELNVGGEGVADPRERLGVEMLTEEVIAGDADHKDAEADEQRHDLAEAGGRGNGDGADDSHGFKEKEDGDADLHESAAVRDEFGADGLDLPLFIHDEHKAVGEGEGRGEQGAESGRENPVVEIVAPDGDGETERHGDKACGDDGPIDMIGGGLDDLVAEGHEKNDGPDPVSHADGGGDAEVFAEDEGGAGDGFGNDGEDGFIFDFAGEDTGCGEGCQEESAQENSGQSHVGHHFVVVVEGVGADGDIEREHGGADADHDDVDGLADGFGEGIACDGGDLLEHAGVSVEGLSGGFEFRDECYLPRVYAAMASKVCVAVKPLNVKVYR